MRMKLIAKEVEGIDSTFKEMQMGSRAKIRNILNHVGIKTIAYLRELINETRPPIRAGEPARQARQGHWADNTGNLARAYAWELDEGPSSITLVLSNSMEYAAALDAKEGFFVLRGVADKGGPVEQMLRKAVKIIAPDWEVRYE
jgi:hypothetical protein